MEISKREKNILIAGAVFLVLFFIYTLGIAPVFEKRQTLNRALVEKQAGLEQIKALSLQYRSVSRLSDSQTQFMASRSKNFSLFSFIDLQAQQSGVKENVEYMKPFTKKNEVSKYLEATVKVKLKEVYLKQLVDFLYRIESSQNGVSIISLSLTKAGKNKTMLDAVLETQTLMQKEGA